MPLLEATRRSLSVYHIYNPKDESSCNIYISLFIEAATAFTMLTLKSVELIKSCFNPICKQPRPAQSFVIYLAI